MTGAEPAPPAAPSAAASEPEHVVSFIVPGAGARQSPPNEAQDDHMTHEEDRAKMPPSVRSGRRWASVTAGLPDEPGRQC
jgi:hypothetical protein